MASVNYWIVRATGDVYSASFERRRVGASKGTLSGLKKIRPGDKGVFYISTERLHGGAHIQEFRRPFLFAGQTEPVAIPIDTLPEEKQLSYSIVIAFENDYRRGSPIEAIIARLDFIKEKEHWGSYLMKQLVKIPEKDYFTILGAMKDLADS